jgi:N-6 DNA Methylase
MRQYEPYVKELQALATSVSTNGIDSVDAEAIAAALDGGAHAALRRLVAVHDLRASGAFFTGGELAQVAWQPLIATLDQDSVITDPACGAGNLLIPGLNHLLALQGEIKKLCAQVRGRDLIEQFVLTTRIRLYLTIMTSPIAESGMRNWSPESFEHISAGDALDQTGSLIGTSTHVVLNPPYGTSHAQRDWAAGSMNTAAIFTDSCLASMRPGAHMAAILPDVLRSGRRYRRWREKIESVATVRQVTPWGLFDKQTDVHVFVMHLTKDRTSKSTVAANPQISSLRDINSSNLDQALPTVSTYFEVTVGAVVPHRHPEEGAERPFATARLLPVWQSVDEIPTKRKFSGHCVTPPFVVVRRTSRPGQAPRARATLVVGCDPIAVDNHLIVLRPRDGSVARCQAVMDLLRLDSTTRWLDDRFRCRHLTVQAVEHLPWRT